VKQIAKQVASKSRTALVAYKMYHNWQFSRRFAAGHIETMHGSTHSHLTLPDSVAYIEAQFADYLHYGALRVDDLCGARIFELGFGDNIGVALRFVAAGAAHVTCLDKFYARRDATHERQIYESLRQALGGEERRRFDAAVSLADGVVTNTDRIECIHGVDVEDAERLRHVEPFDFVVSRAVLQEIFEPDAAVRALDQLLRPGGLMLHKIDLSDMGMFREYGMNPLTFLTIPERIYRLMADGSGKPSRKRMGDYRRLLEGLGYATQILVTGIIGAGGRGDLTPHKERITLGVDYTERTRSLVHEIRPKLTAAFRSMSDEELLVDGIFVVARKPGFLRRPGTSRGAPAGADRNDACGEGAAVRG
jgi:SAM-dependent methyltransferase